MRLERFIETDPLAFVLVRRDGKRVANRFCATGKGGGVKATCKTGDATAGSGGFIQKADALCKKILKTKTIQKLGAPGRWIKKETGVLYKGLEKRYGRRQALLIMGSGQALAWGATAAGAMAGIPVWLPGSTLWGSAPAAALAEVYYQVRKARGKGKGKAVANAEVLNASDIQAEARLLVKQVQALTKRAMKQSKSKVDNVFCPKGKGGGIDPSCSPKRASGVMLKKLRREGGFSFVFGQQKYRKLGDEGYAVSPYPDRTKIVKGRVSVENMRAFMNKNRSLLSQEGHAVGAWYNRENKTTYLDVAVVVEGKSRAKKLGREHNQITIFSFKDGKEIKTGGTGEAA